METYPIFFRTFLECFMTGLVGGDGDERPLQEGGCIDLSERSSTFIQETIEPSE